MLNILIVKNYLKQAEESANERWGELADNDLDMNEEIAQKPSGKIQEKYGKSKGRTKEKQE